MSFFVANEYYLKIPDDEAINLVMKVVNHEIKTERICRRFGELIIPTSEWQNNELDKLLWIDPRSENGRHEKKRRKKFWPRKKY
jgi:hypothetical protein